MSMSYEVERDVLECALAEAERQAYDAGPMCPIRDAWKARVARLRLAIEVLDSIFADEQRQIVEQWGPP